MTYTKSGIIACGAPHSRARYLGEAKLGCDTPATLLLTDEGNALADRFFLSLGCAPDEMPPEVRAEYLNRRELHQFLAGAIYTLELP